MYKPYVNYRTCVVPVLCCRLLVNCREIAELQLANVAKYEQKCHLPDVGVDRG